MPRRRLPAATLLAILALATSAAAAQELASSDLPSMDAIVASALDEPSTAPDATAAAPTPLIYDEQVTPAASSYPGMEYIPGPAPVMVTQPTNWISGPYLKGGTNLVLGEDVLDNPTPGYTIEGGYRVPIGPAFGDRTFLDFGGSYLSAFGDTTVVTPGIVTTRLAGVIISTVTDDDLFTSSLSELKRATVHVGVGWYWGEPIDNRSLDPQLRIAVRGGGRYGHMRGNFFNVSQRDPTDDETFTLSYDQTDTVGGLYAGVEAILLARDLSIGSAAATLDGEFANDWVDFGTFRKGSLGTASIMLGVMLSR